MRADAHYSARRCMHVHWSQPDTIERSESDSNYLRVSPESRRPPRAINRTLEPAVFDRADPGEIGGDRGGGPGLAE